VTGGYDENFDKLQTTEIWPFGDSVGWKYVGRLPSKRWALQGINVDNNLFMAGGDDDETSLADILKFDKKYEEWLKIGEMSKARNYHAITQIPLSEVENYCQ